MFTESERTTMLTIGLLLAVAALVTPSSARHFRVIDPESNQPCVLLDVSFNIKVTALKDGDVAMVRYLTPDDTGVRALGECINGTSEITVNFGESSMWALAFQPYKSHPVAVYRVFQFIPKEIFGSTVYLTDLVGFSAPKPIYLGNASHSYRCDAEDVSEYLQYTPALSGYTFKATVTVFDIHTQGMGLTDSGQFGPAEICPAPVPGPSPKPVTTRTASPPTPVTHIPQPTTPPRPVTYSPLSTTAVSPVTHSQPTQSPDPPAKAPLNSYSVRAGNLTCVAMETTLTVVIKYPVTTSGEYRTATVNVPADARASGDCGTPGSAQNLSIAFLNGWELRFTFSKDPAPPKALLASYLTENSGEPAYRISNITLQVVVHKTIFPDSVVGEGATYTEVPGQDASSFPSKAAANSDFYRCESSTTIVLRKGVEIKTSQLKFKAFSRSADTRFKGRASVCGADTLPKSNAGLIAGIIITMVVVYAICALLFLMVSRRRKVRYDNIM